MHPPAIPSTCDWDTRDHFVQFYEREQTLIASLGEFVHDAIASGGSAIVVASVAHVEALERDLRVRAVDVAGARETRRLDRKSTRLNSSHPSISYAVFCLKKKKKTQEQQ